MACGTVRRSAYLLLGCLCWVYIVAFVIVLPAGPACIHLFGSMAVVQGIVSSLADASVLNMQARRSRRVSKRRATRCVHYQVSIKQVS